MANEEEIKRIKEWCDQKKKEKKKVYIVERNPFADEMSWTRRFVFIEIDRSREIAAKTSLVYDSLTKELWQYINGQWMRVEPSFDIKIE
ncbi:MAG: hypothetical protein PHU63_00200 [Candidatus ainarchaeum sp.]|nr:hypothetical protein [Candidatus ainarchaeum sp.]